MVAEVRVRERNRVQFEVLTRLGAVDQDAVPIDLQICRDADAGGALRQLAAEVGSDGARQAGGESHVVGDADPFAGIACGGTGVSPVLPGGDARRSRNKGLDIRRGRLNPRLRRCVHPGRGEVLNLTVHEQSQRASAIRLA